MNKFKEALTENLVQCKQEKDKRTNSIDSIGKQKFELIENVDKYEEKIIAKIKESANNSRKEIRSIYEEHKTVIDTDIVALDFVIATNTECVWKLDQTDDEELFIYVKTSKAVTKDGESLIQAMKQDWKEREIQFCFDETIEKHFLEVKAFGRVGDHVDCTVKEYRASFYSNVNIKQSHESDAYIFDICVLDTNNILVADHQNKKLKRFNSNLHLKDEIALPGQPIAVCKVYQHEVAVRIWSSKVVHLVSVGQSMQLTSSFTLAVNGYGMTYDAVTGEILACENNKVSVYNKSGNKLRTYDNDTNSVQMFSACRQIALCMTTQDIYITDGNSLIVLNKAGTLKKKLALSGVSDAWSLCLLPGDICLTGSGGSGVIVQSDKDGKQIGNLVDNKDGRLRTFCAVYDHKNYRLIVGGSPSVLYVYTLSAK